MEALKLKFLSVSPRHADKPSQGNEGSGRSLALSSSFGTKLKFSLEFSLRLQDREKGRY